MSEGGSGAQVNPPPACHHLVIRVPAGDVLSGERGLLDQRRGGGGLDGVEPTEPAQADGSATS